MKAEHETDPILMRERGNVASERADVRRGIPSAQGLNVRPGSSSEPESAGEMTASCKAIPRECPKSNCAIWRLQFAAPRLLVGSGLVNDAMGVCT